MEWSLSYATLDHTVKALAAFEAIGGESRSFSGAAKAEPLSRHKTTLDSRA